MQKIIFTAFSLLFGLLNVMAQGENEDQRFQQHPDLKIKGTSVVFDERLDQLIFTIEVEGAAGQTQPAAFGQVDGAPVLGYVFPTTLQATDVGFSATEGIVALALTSHPDFDDTPLWDENSDQNYGNDGVIWHPHWVVLTPDQRVAGGLAVKQFQADDASVKLPPTNPGMPMYMDSPGFPVIARDHTIRVVVPAYRLNYKTQFQFDAVTAYMQVNTSNSAYPMLGVYKVYAVASGDLSLPYQVSK